jgi:hypothetical protein
MGGPKEPRLGSIAVALIAAAPLAGWAQMMPPSPANPGTETPATGNQIVDGRWDLSLEGRVGFPIAHLRVGEFPTGASAGMGGSPGTHLSFHDLGVDVSETVQGSVGFHFTADDAIRATVLYAFMDGSTTLHQPIFFNGVAFLPGSLRTEADFLRVGVDYERTLASGASGDRLVGTIGVTYVYFNPTLTGHLASAGTSEGAGRNNSEDFYVQELPVPILGLRWDHPLTDHLLWTASVSGGGLPKVDSLRTEGGTIYLTQSHADVGLGVSYLLGRCTRLDLRYQFTYFYQDEMSHEDHNRFELFDNGVRLGVSIHF